MLYGERPGLTGLHWDRRAGRRSGPAWRGAHELFHGLMRGTVFAEPDAVVSKYVDHLEAAQSPERMAGFM